MSYQEPVICCYRPSSRISVSLLRGCGGCLRLIIYIGRGVAGRLGVEPGDYLRAKWGSGHQDDGLLLLVKSTDPGTGRRAYRSGANGSALRIELPGSIVVGSQPYRSVTCRSDWSSKDGGFLVALPFWARLRTAETREAPRPGAVCHSSP